MTSRTAVAFPGQGIQFPGMAAQIKNTPAWELFSEASGVLDCDLGQLCLSGPAEQLHHPVYGQAAVYVTCLALWQLHGQRFPAVKVFLGHSLGLIAALTAAGAISFPQGVQLVKRRGELMGEMRGGGMLAVLGLRTGIVRQLCTQVEDGFVAVAGENSPGHTVVSGDGQGLQRLAVLAQERGAKRVVALKAPGPFHSELMRPAAERFAEAVEALELNDLRTPVLSCDGQTLLQEQDEVKRELVNQLTRPVRFRDAVHTLAALGIEELAEVSPLSVLIPMARRCTRNLKFTLVSG